MSTGTTKPAQPSSELLNPWLSLSVDKKAYPRHTGRGGKWLIFVSRDKVDAAWERVRTALIAGTLGSRAKVSTARPSERAKDATTHVICVYTYDSDDRADVMRVREALRVLGFRDPISYKTDRATAKEIYEARGVATDEVKYHE